MTSSSSQTRVARRRPTKKKPFSPRKSVWENGPNSGLGLGLFLACSGSTHVPLPAASGSLTIALGSMDVPLWAASGFLKIASGSTHAPLPAACPLVSLMLSVPLWTASGSSDWLRAPLFTASGSSDGRPVALFTASGSPHRLGF